MDTKQSKTGLRLFLVALALWAFGGCAKPLHPGRATFAASDAKTYEPRGADAKVTDASQEDLQKSGYIAIGTLGIEHVTERCWSGARCEFLSKYSDPTTTLLREAARRGGDLVVMSMHEKKLTKKISKRDGSCIRMRDVNPNDPICKSQQANLESCRPVGATDRQCAEYPTIPGKEHVIASEAVVWRYEPAAAAQAPAPSTIPAATAVPASPVGAEPVGAAPAASTAAPIQGAQGGSCYGNGTCNAGLACQDASKTCAVPLAQGSANAACYGNGTCNAGLSCHPTTQTCVAPLPAGTENGSCYGNGTCNEGLRCHKSFQVCRPARPQQ